MMQRDGTSESPTGQRWNVPPVSISARVLNIAEGNGRIGSRDHRTFIDIAHRSALKSAVVIDLMISKNELDIDIGKIGKRMLGRIVKMALAMRGYLETDASS